MLYYGAVHSELEQWLRGGGGGFFDECLEDVANNGPVP